MATDYEERLPGALSCVLCGREFAPEERYLCALFEEGDQFRRQDYCLSCWPGPPEGSFSYWQGRVPAREERPPRFVDEGELLELFGRLDGVTEPRQAAFRYLLGLLLVRKRLLRLVDSGGAGERPMAVAEPGGGVRYTVSLPRLGQAELAEVSAQMGAVLRMGKG